MNFILAFFIYSMIAFAFGEEFLPVKNVKMGYMYNESCLEAGFQNGDIPLTADNVTLEFMDVKTRISIFEAKEVTVLRNGEVVTINLPPDFNKVLFEEDALFYERFPFVIREVTNGSPAKRAGMMDGDSIIGIGESFDLSVYEIQKMLAENKENEIILNVYRDDQLLSIPIIPDEFGKIGVLLKSASQLYKTIIVKYNFLFLLNDSKNSINKKRRCYRSTSSRSS